MSHLTQPSVERVFLTGVNRSENSFSPLPISNEGVSQCEASLTHSRFSRHSTLACERLPWGVISYVHRSLNEIVAQSKNCSFGVYTTIDLKNMTHTSSSYSSSYPSVF